MGKKPPLASASVDVRDHVEHLPPADCALLSILVRCEQSPIERSSRPCDTSLDHGHGLGCRILSGTPNPFPSSINLETAAKARTRRPGCRTLKTREIDSRGATDLTLFAGTCQTEAPRYWVHPMSGSGVNFPLSSTEKSRVFVMDAITAPVTLSRTSIFWWSFFLKVSIP